MRCRHAALCLAAFAASIGQASAQSLLRDAEIEQWIDDYSRPLFKAAGLPAEEINILLIGDPTPNAFAGGLNMGIFTGLITTADTPNQIEGVIAHETGHIAGGHSARSDEMMSAATVPMILSLVLAAGAIAAGAPDAGLGIIGLGQNIGMANALIYSRGQEAAADQAAITFLDATNNSSEGLIEFFGKLRNQEIITFRKINPYMQSHPLSNQRITALTDRASASSSFENKDSPEEIERLKLIQAKINGFLQETDVTLRQYPLTDQSDPAHYARAVAYYRGSQLEKAETEVDRLIAKFPDNPYYQELKGQMLFEFGQAAASIAPHQKSVDLAPDKALLRINLGRALVGTEDVALYPQAIKELRSALLLEPDNSFGWFELARAYGGVGNEGMASLATAESRYHSGSKGEAATFARRAQEHLKQGTPEYRQASDIIAAAQPRKGGAGPIAPEPEKKPKQPQPEKKPGGEVPDPQGLQFN
ncbi:MAG: M48 family metalloprotease [Parvularculaceae bacterium]